ncbi:hypothetical protein BDZ91DRAFT_849301 [Kalaharituber pfeilii]|nr:hypothetical protein BDZ91DRAFT_849301 [Kalaharituber pfeilii]
MKVYTIYTILLFALLGTYTVLAAPNPEGKARPRAFPGELAMIEAREVFQSGTLAAPPPDSDNGEVDRVPPEEKQSENEGSPDKLFKRGLCWPNYWTGFIGSWD